MYMFTVIFGFILLYDAHYVKRRSDFVSEKDIMSAVKEERRRYAREWRAKNRDKVKAANARYWEKRALARLSEQQGVVSNKEVC